MKVGVDAREIQGGIVTGIGRPLANFIRYFGEHERTHGLVLFSERPLPIEFPGNVENVVIKGGPTFWWDQQMLPRALKRRGIDLFYSPYYKIPLMSAVPSVSQILDLMFLVFPPYRKKLGPAGRLFYATFGRACARRSVNIITDSEHAKQDITRLWKVHPQKITVIPLGLAQRYVPVTDKAVLAETRRRFHLPDRLILYLGNFKRHKNVESLVRAFAILAPQLPQYVLVLAGLLDAHGIRIRKFVSDMGISDRVVFTDVIREEDRPEALLSAADLFVFPSLYEGFGLPPLEAMACGTPVVVSRATAIPEVVDDAAVLVNACNEKELAQAMVDMLTDAKKREAYSQRGLRRAESFREEQTAGLLYRHLLHLLEDVS